METPKNNIKGFISQIVSKDYSQANQALQKIIEDKLKERIKTAIAQKN